MAVSFDLFAGFVDFAPAGSEVRDILAFDADAFDDWLRDQTIDLQNWLKLADFKAGIGQVILLPDGRWILGLGRAIARARERFVLAAGFGKLPTGAYRLANELPNDLSLDMENLGCLLGGYRYGRYKNKQAQQPQLMLPQGCDADRLKTMAMAEALTRNLINTPANDMGPDALEQAAAALADHHGAHMNVVLGDALLTQNFPMIHAVGRAAEQAPRLIDMTWGNTGPQLTLVGKGVCFDTGGLDLKPASAMGLMKKDMGGAANVLGLAHMIMALNLPLRLRVLIPAVENAVAGNAFRPGDVLTARNGLTVEINNTDAEGRLVLADALALAAESPSDLTISMATLTGAARVAVGPDLAPFFAQQVADADQLMQAAAPAADPVWPLPFHTPYEKMIEPDIADLDNAPAGGFAGAITAALFLRRFAGDQTRYIHFDIYAWTASAAPGRPKGGAGQGVRAILTALPDLLDLPK